MGLVVLADNARALGRRRALGRLALNGRAVGWTH